MSAPILLVGAGPAGLVTARALGEAGLSFDWIDRHGEPGGAYRRLYPRMELASPARHSALPGLELNAAGEYLSVGEYASYLDRYAALLGRSPLRATLSSLTRAEGGLRAAAGDTLLGRYRAAVIATGMFDFPRDAAIPGLRGHGGPRVLQTRDWSGPAGLGRALIVGGGMSGTELAEECARAGLPVALSARHPVRLMPRRVLGREIHDWAVLLERLPALPWTKLCRGEERLPGIDAGFRRFAAEGLIRVLPEVSSFDGRRARFVDGRQEEFDAVILATGYRYEAPFLSDEVARHRNGMPILRGGRSKSWPELHFIGLPCSGSPASPFLRGLGRDASRAARRLRGELS